jgi:hypothetical protein
LASAHRGANWRLARAAQGRGSFERGGGIGARGLLGVGQLQAEVRIARRKAHGTRHGFGVGRIGKVVRPSQAGRPVSHAGHGEDSGPHEDLAGESAGGLHADLRIHVNEN